MRGGFNRKLHGTTSCLKVSISIHHLLMIPGGFGPTFKVVDVSNGRLLK